MRQFLSIRVLAAFPPLPQPAGGWVVYLLLCANGSFYCGITNRPVVRWYAHVSGNGARYTRMYRPIRMRLVCCGVGKAVAARCEYWLKRLTAAEKSELWELLDDFDPDSVYPDV